MILLFLFSYIQNNQFPITYCNTNRHSFCDRIQKVGRPSSADERKSHRPGQGPVLINNYRVGQLVGRGAFGEVRLGNSLIDSFLFIVILCSDACKNRPFSSVKFTSLASPLSHVTYSKLLVSNGVTELN